GPASAFLTVWLGASALHHGSSLGGRSALPGVGRLAHEGLVHDGVIGDLTEDRVRQLDVDDVHRGRGHLARLLGWACVSRGGFLDSLLGVGDVGLLGVVSLVSVVNFLLLVVCHHFFPVLFALLPAFCLTEPRTRTTEPLGPGTPPATSTRFRSASTRTTFKPCTVVRTLPIWPAMRTPLKTRAASVAPIDPGLRTFIEPCDSGPRLKRWRLTRP